MEIVLRTLQLHQYGVRQTMSTVRCGSDVQCGIFLMHSSKSGGDKTYSHHTLTGRRVVHSKSARAGDKHDHSLLLSERWTVSQKKSAKWKMKMRTATLTSKLESLPIAFSVHLLL